MMADIDKVINGLDCCLHLECKRDECPYFDEDDCGEAMKRDALEVLKEQKLKPNRSCPICGSEITIEKVRQNGGMDGNYYDWRITCGNCHLIEVYYPADNFYGRGYYKTEAEALKVFNERVASFSKAMQRG